MVSRRELHRTGRKVLVKPFVVLAAKCLGPGRLRLAMVKLAHDLGDSNDAFESPLRPPARRLDFGRAGLDALPQKLSHAAWVLQLWEAFLIQMNDFDRFLESELRRILDPVAASGAPRRARRMSSGSPLLSVVTAPIELVAEALPVVEPGAIPAQPVHLVQ